MTMTMIMLMMKTIMMMIKMLEVAAGLVTGLSIQVPGGSRQVMTIIVTIKTFYDDRHNFFVEHGDICSDFRDFYDEYEDFVYDDYKAFHED